MTINWTKRPKNIEKIRKIEIKEFLKLKSLIGNKSLIDIGCGEDKYLKKYFKKNRYKGIDIIGNVDYDLDARKIPEKLLKNKFVISFGLFILINDKEKIKLLNKIDEGIIHLNRNDTKEGQIIEKSDKNEKVKEYFTTQKKILNIIDKIPHHFVTIIKNPYSFIVYIKK